MARHRLTLLIDAGNTRVKLGWVCGRTGAREPAPLALPHSELDALNGWLAGLPAQPWRAIGVSVAAVSVAASIQRIVSEYAGVAIHWLRSSKHAAGILNSYDEPSQLGPDRWVSLIGLAAHTDGPAILASFGTATTVDTLSARQVQQQPGATCTKSERRFEGGLILPGPDLMRRSLSHGTAGLPYAEGPGTRFPQNTHSAIRSGIAAAQAGAVLRQWAYVIDQFGVAPQIYCTGGGWPLVADELGEALARSQSQRGFTPAPPIWLRAPVLDGLAIMAEMELHGR